MNSERDDLPGCQWCGWTQGHTEFCEGFEINDPAARPTVDSERDELQAEAATPTQRCDHICLLPVVHTEEGRPHFYGYENPSPRVVLARTADLEAENKTLAGITNVLRLVISELIITSRPGTTRAARAKAWRDAGAVMKIDEARTNSEFAARLAAIRDAAPTDDTPAPAHAEEVER